MVFVWTLDSLFVAIMLGILVLMILVCIVTGLISSFIEWFKRRIPHRDDKTHKEESEKTG